MRIIPKKGSLLVELDLVQQRKVGSVWVTDKHSEKIRIATVLDVGSDVTEYKKGDRVILNYYTGMILYILDLGWHDDTHKIVMEDNILGKVE
jgi:co-chaperonin GroES (HSP10)